MKAGKNGTKLTEERKEVIQEGQLLVPVNDIYIAENFRKHYNEQAINELAENVKNVGVLVPILVRLATARGKETFELIAGQRRLKASIKAGKETIPARVMDVDDKTAAEIQAFENLHREDLNAMDEARAFKHLRDQGGYDVQSLAARVSKSLTYVHRSIRLLDLNKEAITAIEQGKLTAAHGHQILRAPAELQAALTRNALKDKLTARGLQDQIDREIGNDLERAAFPKDVDYAGKIPCTKCQLNSGNQGLLFDGAIKGRCTGPECYKSKVEQMVKDFVSAATKNHKGMTLKNHKGMTFLGVMQGYGDKYPKEWTKAREVYDNEWKHPAIKKMVKESPEKFGWAVHSSRWDNGKCAIHYYVQSAATLRAAMPDDYHGTGSDGAKRASARERFIEAAVEKALLEAVASRCVNVTRTHWMNVIDRLHYADDPRYIFERAGITDVKRASGLPDLSKVTEKQLQEIALLLSVCHWGRLDTDKIKSLGIDVKKVEKSAHKAATKAWKAAKEAKKGKGKT